MCYVWKKFSFLCSVLLTLGLCPKFGCPTLPAGVEKKGEQKQLEILIGLLEGIKYDVHEEAEMVKYAISEVKKQSILPDYVNLKVVSTVARGSSEPVGKLVEMQRKHNVSVIIGPSRSKALTAVAKLTSYWNLLNIGHVSALEELANKRTYKTLARTPCMNRLQQGFAIRTFLQNNGWMRVGLIFNSKTTSSLQNVDGIRAALYDSDIVLALDIGLRDYQDTEEIDKVLDLMKDTARIFLVTMSRHATRTRVFFERAHYKNMTGSEYVYIIPCNGRDKLPWLEDRNVKQAYKHALLTVAAGQDDQTVQTFLEDFRNATGHNESNTFPWTKIPWSYSRSPPVMISAVDSVFLYAHALNDCLTDASCDYQDGISMFNYCKNKNFKGAAGQTVITDSSAERYPEYLIQGTGDETDDLVTYFYLKAVNQENKLHREVEVIQPFPWRTETGKPPPTVPKCGFRLELCPKEPVNNTLVILGVLGAGVLLALFVIVTLHLHRKSKFETELLSKSWQVDWREMTTLEHALSVSLRLLGSREIGGSRKSGIENTRTADDFESEKVITKNGIYQNQKVFVKKFEKYAELCIKRREDLLLLKSLKDLQHDNLNGFIGLCTSAGSGFAASVWALCTKGNIADIIYNEEIQLDMTFKASIMRDILNGLRYLHNSPIGVHGQLTVNNCMVDSRWLVKLTDYGLDQILKEFRDQKIIATHNKDKTDKLFHMAPEVLNQLGNGKLVADCYFDQTTDIYSLSIVFFQVLFRQEPYDTDTETAEEILEKIQRSKGDFRPKIPKNTNVHQDLVELLSFCWKENPDFRPTLKRIRNVVHNCTTHFSENIVDHMMGLMEKYADNLEKMVQSRTTELREERERADNLLSKMLPQLIAEKLKSGLDVQPEMFQSVTLMFTDIVEFTSTCAASTPVQVVEMLNQIYSKLDGVIAKYDAYKVETIGDAYLVASGLPNRNGFNHVIEMAKMSTRIIEVHGVAKYASLPPAATGKIIETGIISLVVGVFKIPHLTGKDLEIRIGIHSGSVAAGVVGLSMPRYCLFGDTVNVASRMESTGRRKFLSDAMSKFNGTTPVPYVV